MPISNILDGMPNYRPYSNIQPFTIRDGATYLLQLEALKDWWRDVVVPHIDTETLGLSEDWKELTTKLLLDWETKMGELTLLVTDAVAGIENKVELAEAAQVAAEAARDLAEQFASDAQDVQDGSVTVIVNDEESQLRAALDAFYAPIASLVEAVGRLDDFDTLTATGRLSAEAIDDAANLTRRVGTRVITSEDWGINDSMTAQECAKSIQDLWNFAATNGYSVTMLPGIYEVELFPEAFTVAAILTIPANSDIHFMSGFVIQRADWVEATTVSHQRVLLIGSNSSNSRLSGTLEINGAGDSVTWYNEHNHCVFIYGAENVDAKSLHFIGRNAMGDCLSFSGPGNSGASQTKNVWIGSVELYDARRKSLVVEATVNCGIENAYLENPSGACFDYEPFGLTVDGVILSFRIGTLHVIGRVDLTAGTNRTVLKANLSGDTWTIVAKENDTNSAYLSYGVNLKLNKLYIDARKSAQITGAVMLLQWTSHFNVDDVQIISSDTVDAPNLIEVTGSGAGASAGVPSLSVGSLKLSGKRALNASIRGVGKVGILGIYGADAPTAQVIVSAPSTPNNEATLTIDVIDFVNAHNVSHLLAPSALAGTERIVRIGSVNVFQSDGRITPFLYKALTLGATERVIIKDISNRGGGVAAMATIFPGAVALIRTRNYPEESYYFGTVTTWTPEGVYSAAAGTRVINVIAGKAWIKTTDNTNNIGWVAL